MADYSYTDIVSAYKNLGVKSGSTVYVTGNFGRLGSFTSRVKSELLAAHYEALTDLVGVQGTIVVPTHTFSLVSSDEAFDLKNSKSETGPFSEFVRNKKGAIRQLHPFSSSTAIGLFAEEICSNNTNHVYGPFSPFDRMVQRDAVFVSVGKDIRETISLVHHVEFAMNVPYRYVKSFLKKCRINNEEIEKEFFLFVNYLGCDIERDRNRKIFEYFSRNHSVHRFPLGRSCVEAVSMKDFYDSTLEFMKHDIYAWLKSEPRIKPFRN